MVLLLVLLVTIGITLVLLGFPPFPHIEGLCLLSSMFTLVGLRYRVAQVGMLIMVLLLGAQAGLLASKLIPMEIFFAQSLFIGAASIFAMLTIFAFRFRFGLIMFGLLFSTLAVLSSIDFVTFWDYKGVEYAAVALLILIIAGSIAGRLKTRDLHENTKRIAAVLSGAIAGLGFVFFTGGIGIVTIENSPLNITGTTRWPYPLSGAAIGALVGLLYTAACALKKKKAKNTI